MMQPSNGKEAYQRCFCMTRHRATVLANGQQQQTVSHSMILHLADNLSAHAKNAHPPGGCLPPHRCLRCTHKLQKYLQSLWVLFQHRLEEQQAEQKKR